MPKQKLVNLLLNVVSDGKERYYEQVGTIPVEAELPVVGAEMVLEGRTFTVESMETDEDLRPGARLKNTRYIYLVETSAEPQTVEDIKKKKKLIRAKRNEKLREQMKKIKLSINRGQGNKNG
jgi:hypothetical protein